jgi:hypothetical protein
VSSLAVEAVELAGTPGSVLANVNAPLTPASRRRRRVPILPDQLDEATVPAGVL